MLVSILKSVQSTSRHHKLQCGIKFIVYTYITAFHVDTPQFLHETVFRNKVYL